MRVVIADDSRIERAQVTRILQDAGYTVVASCENGEQAVAAVKEHAPDLVILDVVMPRMTGDLAGREIAQGTPVPAIVFATKNSQRALQDIADALGAAIAVKPYDQLQFLKAVEDACGKRR